MSSAHNEQVMAINHTKYTPKKGKIEESKRDINSEYSGYTEDREEDREDNQQSDSFEHSKKLEYESSTSQCDDKNINKKVIKRGTTRVSSSDQNPGIKFIKRHYQKLKQQNLKIMEIKYEEANIYR